MTSSTCWTVWPRSTGRGVCPLRQRRRVHRRCGCGLVPVQRRRHDLHRSRLAMAERLDRVVQRQVPRRVAQRLAVRLAARGPSPGRGLQNRLQHEPAPHRPRRPHTHRVRPAVQSRQPTESRIATGPTIGSPSHRTRCRLSSRRWLCSDFGRGVSAGAPGGCVVLRAPIGLFSDCLEVSLLRW